MMQASVAWYFDGRAPGETVTRRYELSYFPFVVGRSTRADFSLSDKQAYRGGGGAEVLGDGTE